MPEIKEIRYNKLRTCRQYFLEGSSHCWFWRFHGPAHPFQWFRSDFSIPPTSLQMDKENDSVTHDFGMKFFLLLCRILEERITSAGWNETESCQSRDMVNHEWTHNYSLCLRLLVEYRVSRGSGRDALLRSDFALLLDWTPEKCFSHSSDFITLIQ